MCSGLTNHSTPRLCAQQLKDGQAMQMALVRFLGEGPGLDAETRKFSLLWRQRALEMLEPQEAILLIMEILCKNEAIPEEGRETWCCGAWSGERERDLKIRGHHLSISFQTCLGPGNFWTLQLHEPINSSYLSLHEL